MPIDAKTGKRADGYRYILVGGWVRSKNDGQIHYVYPATVGVLYGVEANQVYRSVDDEGQFDRLRGLDLRGLIILRPDPSGEYNLPEE